MTDLINALRTKDATTQNGMVTNSTTLNSCLDLFSDIGALRGQGEKAITAFSKAYAEDALVAMKILFWSRDVRGGAGERQLFRDICSYLADNHKDSISKNLGLISEYGRFDDLLVFVGTRLENQALELISIALREENALCAKWMPRGNTKNKVKKSQANALRKFLGLDPKEYRKLLSTISNTVEQSMCSGDWNDINYGHVPSKAMSDYMKAFGRHDYEGFSKYLDSVENGEAKINTGAVYPYDIVKNMHHGSSKGADVQWESLPNYMEGNNERVLPMVDVSGSMGCPAGNNANVTCYDVAISLGLYISQRNEGAYKDAFITFTDRPTLQYLKGSLSDRYRQMRGDVGYSTNLEAAFTMLLGRAIKGNVPSKEMPTMILILSDMEFNHPDVGAFNATAQEMIEKQYSDAGYKMPKLVYWNLNVKSANKPVQFDKKGTALVSGFSPALLTSLLAGKSMTPLSMMMDVIGSDRYTPVTV
jgi:hypothetical protein